MFRSFLRSIGKAESVHKLWRDGSIPSHLPQDALAMLVFSDLKNLHPRKVEELLAHVKGRTIALSSLGAFQLLTVLAPLKEKVAIPRDLLEDLSECLRFSRPIHSASVYIRSLEHLSHLMGPFWDPVMFVKLAPGPSFLDECSETDLVRLADLRLGPMPGLRQRLQVLAPKLSPLQQAKLAFFLSEPDLLPSTECSVSPATVAFALQYFASKSCREAAGLSKWTTLLEQRVSAMSPNEAQKCLFSFLALGYSRDSQVMRRLWATSHLGPWESLQARHVCHSIMEPESSEPLPCKIPQLGVNRKVEATEKIVRYAETKRFTLNRNPSFGPLRLDLHINNHPAVIRTVPWDPVFGIYQNFLPRNTVVIDSDSTSSTDLLDRTLDT